MPFVSLTRLRVRSWLYLPQFIWRSLQAARQAERSAGFIGGTLSGQARSTYWTITVWTDEARMRDYRNSGAHRAVMPRLLDWCDEAMLAHWQQEGAELPPWPEAHRRMVEEGRLSKVKHPSPGQDLQSIPPPRPGRLERKLKPKS